MTLSADPQKPSPEERDCYYIGLAGQPKLIARTSCDPWVKPFVEEDRWQGLTYVPARKRYSAIHDRDMVSKWSADLAEQIIRSLRGCSWNFFFPIRIGLEHKREQYPVILVIAVENDSLSWEDGIPIALECRELLRKHDIHDVEVEIREGRRHFFAASAELESLVNLKRDYGSSPSYQVLPLLSLVGSPIAYLENRPGQGTLGLHVKLHGDESTYGLTCRHVVSRGRPAKDCYKLLPTSEPQYHIQANATTFEDCQWIVEYCIRRDEEMVEDLGGKKRRWEEYYYLDESKSHLCPTAVELYLLEFHTERLACAKKWIDPLRRIEDKSARMIGQLMFHSSMEFSTHQKGYLKDWALIKLDEHKFTESPKNRVFVGSRSPDTPPRTGPLRNLPSLKNIAADKDGILTLTHTYKEDKRSMDVAKFGATTMLTYGLKTEIEAVVRKPGDLEGHQYAWQMVIIPSTGRFSDRGDSGSCVFNRFGQIMGLLSSSDNAGVWPEDGRRRYPGGNISPSRADKSEGKQAEVPDGMDITFADPIQWVFDDIERFTSRKVELA
ncbi:hypothetical protein F4781DRAFT_98528 [Annulohypoxylon bovei var. microspora]|nr:hypothetical protein F4781DRAFT_98528 [Annulohypoxylon bovei var. microspora]